MTPSNDAPSQCLSEDDLRALLMENGNPEAEAEDHLEHCASCRDSLQHLADDDDSITTLLSDHAFADAASAELDTAIETLIAQRPLPRQQVLALLGPPATPDSLGSLGPQLEVLSFLGQGGMGAVLRARDTALDREVAVKLLRPDLAADAELVARFRDEARAVAALDHENVIPIHQVATLEPAGIPYFVMPLAKGPTLARRLRERGHPGFDTSLAIALRASRALAAAHAAGLIHRDLKPGNLLLGSGDEREDPPSVWLSDFGLASRQDASDATQSGGTPGYLAPELLSGGNASAASDLWSLGCLFADLSGDDTPGWFRDLSERLRADDPARRPESAREVVRLLERRGAGRHRVRRRRIPLAVAALVALVAVAVLVSDLTGRSQVINDALRASSGNDFTLRGRLGTYAGLASAIEAARDGDEIQIHGPGPFEVFSLGRRNISLVIRADPRLVPAPVLRMPGDSVGPTAMLWIYHGDLTLEGLDLRHENTKAFSNRRIPALVRMKNGNLTLRNCRLERIGIPSGNESPLVFVSGQTSIDMADSDFSTDHGPCLIWRIGDGAEEEENDDDEEGGPALFTLNHCRFDGHYWIGLSTNLALPHSAETPDAKIEIRATDCLVRSAYSGIVYRTGDTSIPLRVETQRCLIETGDKRFINLTARLEDSPDGALRLRDSGSTFAPAPGGPDAARAQWISRWGEDALDDETRWVDRIDFPSDWPPPATP